MNLGSLIGYLGLDTKDWDKGLDKAEGGLKGFAAKGAALAATAGAGIAAAVVGAVVSGMNIEAANDKLAAQLGATGEHAADLGKIAGSLYANAYGSSLEEVNVALRGVMQSGAVMEDASNEQIESITAKVLDLATAFDQDLGATTTAVGQMIRTGLAKDADEALDIITRGMQQGADASGDLLDTFVEYPALFQRLGLDGKTSMGMIEQAMNAGARNSDLAADALKEFQIRATDGSKTSADAFKLIGMNAERMTAIFARGGPEAADALANVMGALRDMEDPVARNAAAVGLFGTQAEDLGEALYAMDPESAVDALGKVEGAAAAMGKTLNDNASTNLESFKRQAMSAFVDVIGGKVLPIVSSIASTLATQFGPAVSAVAGFLSSTLLPAAQAVFGFLGDHQTTVKVIASLIGGVLVAAFTVWATRATMAAATNTIAWFTTAAAATTSAGRQKASALQVVAGWTLMAARALVQGIKIAAVWTAQIVASAASGAAAFAVQTARVVAGWVLMGVQSLLQAARMAAAWLIAMGPVGWVIAAVVALVALIVANWDTVVSWTKAAWSAVTGAIGAAWEWIKGAVAAALQFVVNLFLNFTGPGLIIKHWDTIKNATVAAWNAVVGFITGAWNRITGAVSAAVGAVKNAVSGAWNSVKSFTQNAWNAVTGVVSGAWNNIRNAVSGGINGVIDWVRGLPGRVLGALGNIGSLLFNAGMDLIRGFMNGIKNMAGAVANAAKNVAASAVNGVKGFLGINSPSKVFAGLGENVGQGFVNGIAAMRPAVAAEMQRMANYQAVADLMPGKNMVKLADISWDKRNQLLAAGWKGRAGDGVEALYRPAGSSPTASTASASSGHITVNGGVTVKIETPLNLTRPADLRRAGEKIREVIIGLEREAA